MNSSFRSTKRERGEGGGRGIYTVATLCNPDTNGTEESVHIREVSLFQGLNCMQKLLFGKERCPY